MQKLYKAIEILQSYDHKCTATFLWFTVYFQFPFDLLMVTCIGSLHLRTNLNFLASVPYFDFSTPICLFLIQLSWATMTIKGSLQVSIPIVKAFLSRFLVQNLAGSRDLQIGSRRWPRISIPQLTGLRWQLKVVYRGASLLRRPFWAEIFQVQSKIGPKFPFSFGGRVVKMGLK